jgi:Lipid A 3-O-deacylase (PagL)
MLNLSFGQRFQQFKPTSLSLISKGGFLIAHRANMAHLPDKNTYAFEVEIVRQDTSINGWNEIYKNPLRGLSLQYQDFGNKVILGQGYSLFAHTTFPIIQKEKFGFLDFRLGTGIGVVTKKYDAITNPKHIAIGSYLNGFVNLRLQWNKYFQNWHIGAGLEFAHFSNSAMIVPNLGLNLPSITFNVGYDFQKRALYDPGVLDKGFGEGNTEKYEKRMADQLRIFIIGSGKQNDVQFNPAKVRPIIALQGLYSIRLGKRWKFDTGIDLMFNGGNQYRLDTVAYSVGRTIQMGLFVGASIHFYNAEFLVAFGAYVRSTVTPYGWIYNRLGFRYHFTDRFSALVGIKAHFAVADYLEMGIGYKLGSWRKK